MTGGGMKSGPGTDPFDDSDTGAENEEQTEPERNADDIDVNPTGHGPTMKPGEDDPVRTQDLPWYFRRRTVSEGRDAVKQLELRQETLDDMSDAVDELADRVGLGPEDPSFYTTDAREAILLAGVANLGDAAEQLREWGYDRVKPGR